MVRQVGPDQSERMWYYTVGPKKGKELFPPGTPVPLYADVLCTLPADVLSADGATIAGTIPTLLIGDTYETPLFQFPDVPDPVVFTRVGGGPVTALHPRTDDRVDALAARLTAVEAGGSGDTLLLHKAGAETVPGVKTFSAEPVVPTPTVGTSPTTKAYVDAADAAVTAAVAADATTKVATEATSRAAADSTLAGLITAEAATRASGDAAAQTTAIGAAAGLAIVFGGI